MQEQNRAKIIGTQSCGCVLGVLNHKRLKGGADLAISEIGFITSKGRTLEGNGVTPDKSIAVTLADLQNQRDVALKEAEEYFNKKEN
jgi:carboxyl-terminal processing protease